MTAEAYLRSVGVLFGKASPVTAVDLLQTIQPDPFKGLNRSFSNENDDGIRISFDAFRTASMEPDRCTLTMWNLSGAAHEAIAMDYQIRQAQLKEITRLKLPSLAGQRSLAKKSVSELHKVTLYAGYQDSAKGIFVGDYMSIAARERDGPTDTRTVIELGDSALAIQNGFLDNPVGPGETYSSLILKIVSEAGLRPSADSSIKIAKVVPGAKIQAFTGGAIGSVSTSEALDDLAEITKVVMFVRDGEWHFLPDGDVFDDFGIAVIEGRDILDFTKGREEGEVQFRTNLNGDIVPGRAIFAFDALRKPLGIFRCETAVYRGDTETNDWYTEFVCSPYVGIPPAVDVSVLA